MVPNHVIKSAGFSAEALGVLIFLMSNTDGFTVSVAEVCAHFQFGKAKWQRIANELRGCNALRTETNRQGGKARGRYLEVFWPVPPCVTDHNASESSVFQLSENPPLNTPKSAPKHPKTRPRYKTYIKNTRENGSRDLFAEWLKLPHETKPTFQQYKAEQMQ